ncbi:MAG TPA: hypothetical protein VH520_10475 [Streptosporangiaceae bacterium]
MVRPRIAALAALSALVPAALLLAGCGAGKPAAAAIQDCGTGKTAANVPVEIEVDRGQVSCQTAMQVEAGYAQAIAKGLAPGNGGGGPVNVSGWRCQGLDTPQLLKTGETSKCVKDSLEIVAILKTS